jgi:CheY-like chemotaxis protein
MQPSPLGASPGTRVDGGYYPATAGHDGVGQYYSSAEDPSAAPTPFAFPTAARPQSATTDGSGHHPAPHQPQGDPAAGGEARGGATTSSTWKQLPRVLVVEDDVVCRRLSSRFLEVFGCQIDTAVDGVEAVKKMNMQPYDLVFMVRVLVPRCGMRAQRIVRTLPCRISTVGSHLSTAVYMT